MLKNKLIVKKIRNIVIFIMAIAILIGTYTYVRRSRAENIIQVELEISDKSETLELQKITVDATETQDGNYLLDLPTAVNGNIVTKYYTTDGAEVVMNDENADKTLTLTQTEVDDLKVQLQTDYDKKEIETEDGQIITLYNKELLAEKKTEEETSEETITEEGETNQETKEQNSTNEITENETTENETTENETTENETTENETTENELTESEVIENETTEGETTEEKVEFDDTVIVTGYMPLEAQVDIKEIDLSTLSEIQLPSDTQTMQKAYEVSVYQIVRRTFDVDGNLISEKTVMSQNLISDVANNEEEDTAVENETEGNEIAENEITENEITENENTNIQENSIIEDINAKNAKENENVESITEGTTPDNTTITTIMLKDGTRIEEEKMEYDPSIYNESIVIKTKNTEENTLATIYTIQEDNQIVAMESTVNKEYIHTTFSKDNQTVRYILAVEPNELPTEEIENDIPSSSGIETMAITDGNMLRSTSTETGTQSAFLGNTNIKRSNIDNVTFVSSTSGANSTAWDVSDKRDKSILAWYETNANGTLKVYIGSNEKIYANTDSSYLFAYIGNETNCTSTEIITNIGLLNTSNVTNMSSMFRNTGAGSMISLDLGENFDTSSVTNMNTMFSYTGFNSMTNLDLGENFDTSNVTSMHNMFDCTGYYAMTNLDLGDKFDTGNVTNMSSMFFDTGATSMKSLNLGSAFTKIAENNKDMFFLTGKSKEIVIQVPEEIYQDSTHFKLNANSNETIEFTRGTIILRNMLKSTSTETEGQSAFLGNTNIQREKVDNVTFMDYIPEDVYDASTDTYINSTAWDVTAGENKSILAWYETNENGTVKVYIGSNETIYANMDSSYLFAYIGLSEDCNSDEIITNIELLNTSKVTDMSYMFYSAGYKAMKILDLGDKFDTSNVTNMSYMFFYIGYNSMTSLDLGEKFDTSKVTNMSHMFEMIGIQQMTSLVLGDKFFTDNVTDMTSMFSTFSAQRTRTLDLGPAFTKIADINTGIFDYSGIFIISAPETIYSDNTNFKLNANSSTTIKLLEGNITPKYRTEWLKESTQIDETDINNPKMNITLRGTTNTEVASNEYISDVTSSLTTNDIKVYIDDTEITDIVTKEVGTATQIANTRTGAQDVLQIVTLSNFEEATRRTGKDYKEWSGNIRIEVEQGTLTDTTYGNSNMDIEVNRSRTDSQIEDATKVDKNTTNAMFIDYIEPEFTYQYSSTDINHEEKTLTVDFSVTDKYFESSEVLANAENITVKMLDTNVVPENLTKTLRKVQDITETRDGTEVKIGEKYRFVISGFEKASIDNGKYKEYSGPVSIVFPAGMVSDKSGNTNVQKNITVGIDEPDGTGDEEIVDFVKPEIEKIDSSVNVKEKTATLKFVVTDKYLTNSTLTTSNIQVLVNGSINTTIGKQLASTVLNEQRVVDGVNSTAQYGTEYTLTLSGIDTTVNQIKVRIPAGVLIDTSGNGNKEANFIIFNTLRSTSTETGVDNNNSAFLGNTNIERGNIDNVIFMDDIPEDVYDKVTNTYKDDTAWDVSVMQDNSIIAWYEEKNNETVKVYIASSGDIYANTDASYLFSGIGTASTCTSTEIITNLELLNTSNVTNMSHMFYNTGKRAMTSLDLGDNFDTSNVTNMSYMFGYTGYQLMKTLDLGDNFDTSNVTNMSNMFSNTGFMTMTSLYLGEKFDTSKVTNMSYMFYYVGYMNITSLDLGNKFDTSKVTDMSYMFCWTGYTAMNNLELGEKFDTNNVTNMRQMFSFTGYNAMTRLNLGDKFDTNKVNDMEMMFYNTGYESMISLDLGPAFTNIAPMSSDIFSNTGKSGSIIIQAPEAIYIDETHFEVFSMNGDPYIGFTRGKIEPKYRTEWIKEEASLDETETNNPKINITLRGTTNQEVSPDEYISDVTSSLTPNDIKVFIDNIEITDVVTKEVGSATQTDNARTGAKDVLQVVTLSNFEEATIRIGKSYKEWSGNIRIEVAQRTYDQGTLSDTTYGNSNMEVASSDTYIGAETGAGAVSDFGARIDNIVQDKVKVDQNTEGAMFADFIKPEFVYNYSSTDINYEEKTLTVDFSVTDKYFKDSTVLTNQDNITVKMLDTNAVPENITKTLTKVEDITETREGADVKIGEKYRLVISGFEQASKAEDGKYKEYSGPVSILFPAGMASDKSGNQNDQKNITIGIDEPNGTGDVEIVDVVAPIWEAKNVNIDRENHEATVELYGTDKYYANNTLDINKIKVIVDGEEVTNTECVIKELSAPEVLNETRDGENVPYGVKYTLTLSNWAEEDSVFEESGRTYREYSGNTELQIEAGSLVDESGNANVQTTLDIGKIDVVSPDILKVSSNVDNENKKETIVFDVIDKEFETSQISTTDTSKIHVYVDDEEATTVTKTITNVEDVTAMVNGRNEVVGKRYTLELTNFEQPRTSINYNREYADWSGDVSIKIDAGIATDKSGNENVETTLEGDFVDFIKPNVTYQFTETDIDHDGKTFTMVFDITDKFYTSGTLALEDLAIRIDGEEPDWTEVNKALQVEDRTNEVNGESKVIGKRYTLTLSNLEQLQVKEGDNYLEYSGVITVAIPADKVVDTTGNANDATTITSGISIPGGVVGEEEIVDVVNPLVEKMTSNVDVANKTAEITFKATDKYFENSTLTNENIQIVVNGSVNTSITKQLTSTPLNEQRVVDGVSSTVQYGVQYTLALTGLDTTVNQIKVRIPEGLITDQFGNGNKETDLIVFNTLRNTSTEANYTAGFLGNSNIQRQNIDNVTFMDNIPESVYDVSTNTYIDNTAWDVSEMQDNTIIAWYETSGRGMKKVYIGSNDEIFGNVDSSYLFSYIGYEAACQTTEMITNISLLNTSNVTNMSYMFYYIGYWSMIDLDLGENFDTSNVKDMSGMFSYAGYTMMINLELGERFDTSNVTNMSNMFYFTGVRSIVSLDLGENFNTINVTNMRNMFNNTGQESMTSLDLGDKFDTRNVTDMSNMFNSTGYSRMTSLDLGDKFDTRSVTNMANMFNNTGSRAMKSLDLGYKFDIRNVTDMSSMFSYTGYDAMTSLDLGPAFTKIPETNTDMFSNTGRTGQIVIQAPEAIYQDETNFKLNDGSNTTIEFTRGTITPKYRTEWMKEGAEIDETDANNPKLNITLRGTTNTEIDSSEYISDVTSLLTPNDIKVYIDDTEITDVVTKEIGTATQTDNTRTGAKDILQVVTLSNFEEATIRTGKSYKEWSGNIRIEVAQGSLSDTTGPADEEGNKTTYGNKNMALAEDGSRLDNAIEDETKVDQNTEDVMFADFVKPGFVYNYSSTDINYEEKTLTVDFSVTDKYFKDSTVLTNQDNITVKMLDTNAVPENITKTLTKVEDITETREGADVKIGEKYRLVISGFEQASKAEDGKYKEYSGPVSILFPAGMASDKSGNQNDQKNITIGIDEPNGTGDVEIVDVVAPIWEAKNVNIDRENHEATVELYGTDKYYANNTLDINKIKVIVDGEEVTNTECVIKELSAPEILTEVRDEETVPYGVKYTLTLSNWKESDTAFQASEKIYREYSGNTEIQIQAGTLVDESGNENLETTMDLGMIDLINPEIYQISSTKDETEKTATIIFEVVDKYFESAQISTTDTSKLTIFVDNEEAIGVTKTITNEEDITTTVAGNSKVVGKRYTLVISNFEQPRTTIDYDREYSDWSGNVTVKIDAGTIVDESGNSN